MSYERDYQRGYTLKYACGHVQQMKLEHSQRERERYARERVLRPCKQCELQHMIDQLDELYAQYGGKTAKILTHPRARGLSARQKEWVIRIQHRTIVDAHKDSEKQIKRIMTKHKRATDDEQKEHLLEMALAFRRAVAHMMTSLDNPLWWLDEGRHHARWNILIKCLQELYPDSDEWQLP